MNAISQKAKEIFVSLVDGIAEAEREKLADEACRGDVELRRRVHALLLAHAQPDSRIEHAALDFPVTVDHSIQITEKLGTLIGRYKLLEQVGEGGMGIVFVAEQTEPVRRRVALKIIKPGMDTKQVIARFEAERQALAMMDHPNIARVLDAGTTDAGRPYFVMELVRGMPITEYCDKARLSPRQRLKLFVDVCQAVQHAHQKGIIHRDLKPSNVLVTLHDGVPVVKVIDFGVAKAVGQQLTERTIYTALTQLVGTPLYMSPEQAEMSGLDVDTRSDVYSLGVLLYELLTGQTPFDKDTLGKAGLDEMRRIIREDEPLRPSRRFSTLGVQAISTASQHRGVDERRLSKILSGELDWIVMKALEKDRSRRYESASALAADIQRYLSDEPVLACPPTTMYRFHKFARKHKPALATAAAIATCLVLGTTVSAWQAVRATTAEAQANVNEAQAKEAAEAEAKQRQRAEANEQKANTQRNEAQQQRDEAQRQRDEVKALNQQLRRTLYASNINLAKTAWDAGNIRRVDELLDQHRPKPGETDLRGFEWHYLYRLCHSELFMLKANGATVGRVVYSPDGKRLAGLSWDRTNNAAIVTVWDAQTGEGLVTLKGHSSSVAHLAFSPDGKRLASASDDKTAKLWDAQTGQELLTFKGHSNGVVSAAFSPDGKRLATGSGNWNDNYEKYVAGQVKVWDADNGQELFSIKGLVDGVVSVAFSPDGKRLASVSGMYGSDDVKLWDAQTGAELLFFKDDRVQSVVFSPDGKRLASAGRIIKTRDSETGKELLALKDGARSVAFSPDGKRLVCANRNEIKVRDSETGDELFAFKPHTASDASIAVSPDGTRLAAVSSEGIVKVWDATADQESRTVSQQSNPHRSVSFSPDGNCVAFSTSGALNETKDAHVDAEVKICDAHTGQELISFRGHLRQINSVAYSPDGKRLASASSDKTVKVWDVQSGREVVNFQGHTGEVMSVSFSPDGTRLASSISQTGVMSRRGLPGEKSEVKVWDASSGQELFELKGHSRYVNCVTFSPDGKRLATLSRDQTLKVWDAQTGQEILTLKVLVSMWGSVAFSPDGKWLASNNQRAGSRESGEVKVWDARSGEELLTLLGHAAPVFSVMFSPDGKRLVTGAGGYDPSGGEMKVWDALTGQELLTLKGGSGVAKGVVLSPDGYRLTGKGRDGTLKIWDATPLPEKP